MSRHFYTFFSNVKPNPSLELAQEAVNGGNNVMYRSMWMCCMVQCCMVADGADGAMLHGRCLVHGGTCLLHGHWVMCHCLLHGTIGFLIQMQ